LSTLRQLIEASHYFKKTEFSCLANTSGRAKLEQYKKPQIVLAGIETHICILQTALDLLSIGKQVFVIADATDSRFAEDKNIALARMQQAGIHILSKQMVLFEWARSSEHPAFQTLSKQMLK
jgi:nicotinamidase-related amidase